MCATLSAVQSPSLSNQQQGGSGATQGSVSQAQLSASANSVNANNVAAAFANLSNLNAAANGSANSINSQQAGNSHTNSNQQQLLIPIMQNLNDDVSCLTCFFFSSFIHWLEIKRLGYLSI